MISALPDADIAPRHPTACKAGLLARTGPTTSPVTGRQAGGGEQVPAGCETGRQQDRSSWGCHWSPLAHRIAQPPWGSWEGAQRWRSQEKWPEKIRPEGAFKVLTKVGSNDRKWQRKAPMWALVLTLQGQISVGCAQATATCLTW